MRLNTYIWAGIVAAVGMTAPISAYAQQPEEIRLEHIELRDADMIFATQQLTKRTGLMFIIEPSNDPFPPITLSLKNVTADEAIRYICLSAGASYRRDANGVYIISRGKAPVEPTKVETVVSVPTNTKPLITKKIRVIKGSAEDVHGRLLNPDYQEKGLFHKIQERFNSAYQQKFNTIGTGPLLMSSNGFQPLPTGQIQAHRTESGQDIILPGESGAQGPRGGGGQGGPLGGGGQQGGGGQGAGQGGQLRPGDGLVGRSIDFISYDPTDNSIVVRGSEEDIAELQRHISMFDVAPKQCVIKVEFITTSSSLNRSLGFEWLYERGTIFAGMRPGSFARTGDPVFLNYATGNFTTRMRALLQDGFGRVVNAPVVRTLNNQPAFVSNSIVTTIFLSQVVGTGNQTITAPQAVQIPFITFLGVAPRINDDGTVTTYINVNISDLGQLRRSPDGAEFPDQLNQTIGVVARVKSGETIALGGLTRKSETGSQSRFPILGDLPIIGQFFRSSSRDSNNSELIIFVTPTVIEDDSNTGLGP